MRKITYIVEIDLNSYQFEDGAKAIEFATIAASNRIDDGTKYKINIKVNIEEIPTTLEKEDIA